MTTLDTDKIETRCVPVDSLCLDPRFQMRMRLDRGTVDRYAHVYSSGNTMPPIRVAVVNGAAIVVDGWHRVAALRRLGVRDTAAEVVTTSIQEALWMAAQANLGHGLPLKPREVRKVFRAYVRAKKHRDDNGRLKSFRVIAGELGGLVGYTTVRNWMRQDFPKIAAKYGQDGNAAGGLREPGVTGSLYNTAADNLRNALAAYRGVTDDTHRAQLVKTAQDVLREMMQGFDWEEHLDF